MTKTTEQQRLYAAKYRKRRALNGNKPLTVNAMLAAARLRQLRAAGMGMRRVSEASTVDRRSLQRILSGQHERVSLDTYNRIMSVEPDAGHLVDALGTHRRIQALVAIGYSMSHLERLRGKGGIWRQLQLDHVYADVAMDWARLYDELSMKPPVGVGRGERAAIARAKAMAKRRNWAPPLAWDDIDNPAEKPKHRMTKALLRKDDLHMVDKRWEKVA